MPVKMWSEPEQLYTSDVEDESYDELEDLQSTSSGPMCSLPFSVDDTPPLDDDGDEAPPVTADLSTSTTDGTPPEDDSKRRVEASVTETVRHDVSLRKGTLEEEDPSQRLTPSVSVSLVSGSTTYEVDGSVLEGKGETEMLGGTGKGSVSVLQGKAKAQAGFSVGPDGVKVVAEAGAEANLVALEGEWAIPFEFEFLGETFSGHAYLKASGKVGAEVKRKIEANAKLAQSKGVADPDQLLEGTGLDNGQEAKPEDRASGTVEAEAFLGGKINAGAGGIFDWHRAGLAAYKGQLEGNSDFVLSALSAGYPGLGWLLRQADTAAVIADVLADQLDWSAGKQRLLAVEGLIEGSAGIGAKLMGKAGFSGGKITFKWAAGVTFGLGAGVAVNVSLDAVEGMKLALVSVDNGVAAIKSLASSLKSFLKSNASMFIDKLGGMWNSFFGWLSADNTIRDAIANKAHELAPAETRGEWIETLASGWCGDEDELAIIEILKASKRRGDLAAVLGAGLSKDEILDEFGSDNRPLVEKVLG